jgi:hypothetical protein
MFLSLLLLATVVPGALAAADEAETKAHRRSDSVLVSPVEDPAVRNVVPNTAIVPNDHAACASLHDRSFPQARSEFK